MRSAGPLLTTALQGSNPTLFIMLEMTLSIPYYVTSLPYTVYYNNTRFLSDSGVKSFGPPRSSSTVDREIYELAFVDHADEIQYEIRRGLTGAPLTVYAGFLDSTGRPILSRKNVIVAYSGFIDTGNIVNDGDQKIARIQAASPMANLDLLGAYIVSRDGMDQVSQTDTSFDDVYAGGKAISLKWGKV